MITEQERREIDCFGTTVESLRKAVEESFAFQYTGFTSAAMSLMSDAQEEIALGHSEKARQLLNCAKWVLSTYKERN